MLNVYELENRWKIYKIKSLVPYGVIALSSIVIIIITNIFLFSGNDVAQEKTNLQTTLVTPNKEIVSIVNKPTTEERQAITLESTVPTQSLEMQKESPSVTVTTNQANDRQKERVILTPSLSFMKTMDRDSLPTYEDNSNVMEESNQESFSNHTYSVPEKAKTIVAPQPAQVTSEPIQQPSSISIQRKDTLNDLEQVVKRFEKNENPALSLFIAKKYYELGDYHKAYSYALRTNDLNSNIEESWIIFSKALVKLNEKEMAIKTLKQYIQHSNSNQAKVLLDEINSGKFK